VYKKYFLKENTHFRKKHIKPISRKNNFDRGHGAKKTLERY
jgi:hypothetical protein